MVSVKKLTFREGHIPTAMTWTTMVIILKGGWEYRRIVLVKVIWKVCTLIMNKRLLSTINLHGALQSFRNWRGAGTSNMEAKLAHQLAGMCHETLFQVFLYVWKA